MRLTATGLAANTRVIYTSDHGDNAGARGLWGKSTLYEESSGVPMIVAGPGLPAGRVVATPVSHIDCAPAILDAAGAHRSRRCPVIRCSISRTARNRSGRCSAEYHAIGSTGGAFMLRHGRYKYCHYVNAPPQLFDLDADPEELVDLAGDPRHAAALAECERRLRGVLDPEAVDARAKERQAALLAEFGGREKALARGDLGFTPAPGSKPDIN